MTRANPSNPFSNDPGHTRKDVPMSIQRAKVINSRPSDERVHQVTIRVFGDEAPYEAMVIPQAIGSVWIPKENTDVAVIFGEADTPWVIGPWYAEDRVVMGEVDMPDYEPGELVLGNHTDSEIRVDNNGDIHINSGSDGDVYIDGTKQ